MRQGIVNLSGEIWKSVEGYEGIYEVSNKGRVLSLGNPRIRKPKLLKLSKFQNYLQVQLWKEAQGNTMLVHRLVAQMFIPNPNNLPVVMHLDDIGSNNCVENLRWGTLLDNNKDRDEKGRVAKGETHYKSKFSDKQVAEIRDLYSTGQYKQVDLIKRFGISPSQISVIVNFKQRI